MLKYFHIFFTIFTSSEREREIYGVTYILYKYKPVHTIFISSVWFSATSTVIFVVFAFLIITRVRFYLSLNPQSGFIIIIYYVNVCHRSTPLKINLFFSPLSLFLFFGLNNSNWRSLSLLMSRSIDPIAPRGLTFPLKTPLSTSQTSPFQNKSLRPGAPPRCVAVCVYTCTDLYFTCILYRMFFLKISFSDYFTFSSQFYGNIVQ